MSLLDSTVVVLCFPEVLKILHATSPSRAGDLQEEAGAPRGGDRAPLGRFAKDRAGPETCECTLRGRGLLARNY